MAEIIELFTKKRSKDIKYFDAFKPYQELEGKPIPSDFQSKPHKFPGIGTVIFSFSSPPKPVTTIYSSNPNSTPRNVWAELTVDSNLPPEEAKSLEEKLFLRLSPEDLTYVSPARVNPDGEFIFDEFSIIKNDENGQNILPPQENGGPLLLNDDEIIDVEASFADSHKFETMT